MASPRSLHSSEPQALPSLIDRPNTHFPCMVPHDPSVSGDDKLPPNLQEVYPPLPRSWIENFNSVAKIISRRCKEASHLRTQFSRDHVEWSYRMSNCQQQREYLRESIEGMLGSSKGGGNQASSRQMDHGEDGNLHLLQQDCSHVDYQERQVAVFEDQLRIDLRKTEQIDSGLLQAISVMESIIEAPWDNGVKLATQIHALEKSCDDCSASSDSTKALHHEVRKYYDEVGSAKICQERLVELLFGHHEEQNHRDLMKDQGQDPELSEEDFERLHTENVKAANIAVQEAVGNADRAFEVCERLKLGVQKVDLTWEANASEADQEAISIRYHEVSTGPSLWDNRSGACSPPPRIRSMSAGERLTGSLNLERSRSAERIEDWLHNIQEDGRMLLSSPQDLNRQRGVSVQNSWRYAQLPDKGQSAQAGQEFSLDSVTLGFDERGEACKLNVTGPKMSANGVHQRQRAFGLEDKSTDEVLLSTRKSQSANTASQHHRPEPIRQENAAEYHLPFPTVQTHHDLVPVQKLAKNGVRQSTSIFPGDPSKDLDML